MAANNTEMINRARAIERGEIEATEKDKAFLTHELRENNLMNEGMDYDEVHAQSCKEYGITFSEEMERPGPFYTEKAMEDWERQLSF